MAFAIEMDLGNVALLVWGPLLMVMVLALGTLGVLIWQQRDRSKRPVARQRAGAGVELGGRLAISAARR